MKDELAVMTVATYNASAKDMASHFKQYSGGVDTREIDEAFKHIPEVSKARVVEIGCGSGKHAYVLVKRVGWYEGFDPSEKLLEVAHQHVPDASFVLANALQYAYPDELDAVFAFASLLHVDKDDFRAVCQRVAAALKPGGLFCMTLKESDTYKEEMQEDDFGKRYFYLYNPALVCELAGPAFESVYEDHLTLGPKQKPWFSLILRKKAATAADSK